MPTLGDRPLNDDDKAITFANVAGERVLGSLATPASVEAWITTSTTTDQDSIYNNGSATGSLDVGVTSGSVFVYRPGVAGSYFDTGALKVNDGVAHYVVYTYDGTTGKIFVDGVLRAQQAQGSGTVTAATYISYDGATSPGNGYFTGTIDEVATFSTALTCTGVSVVGDACTGGQIKTHFDRGRDFGLTIAESTANQHVPALTASSASRPTLFVGPGAAAATFTVTSNAADALDSPSDGITGVTFPASRARRAATRRSPRRTRRRTPGRAVQHCERKRRDRELVSPTNESARARSRSRSTRLRRPAVR